MHCYLLPGRLDWNAKKQSEQQKIRPQGKSALWVFYPSVYRDPGDKGILKGSVYGDRGRRPGASSDRYSPVRRHAGFLKGPVLE